MINGKNIKIVIVEDDLYYNKALTKYVETICESILFKEHTFEINSFLTAHDAIEQLDDLTDIMILDYTLVNETETDVLNGENVIDEVEKHCPKCKIIVVSAAQNPAITARVMKRDIYEYIDKNINSKNRIGAVLQRAIVSHTR
ncbi:MAG: response regulator [Flavobacteriales bacterium]|nr:response regulator [Flavobacteriales bacterium]PIE87053.1 MAG: hypothetical protein CSA03_02250 [Bacteroidota bacterium]